MARFSFKLRGKTSWIVCLMVWGLGSPVWSQLTDVEQAPNTVNEGIQKSYQQQIGQGRGDVNTQDSSLFIIARDPFRSIARGRQLFQRKFTIEEGMGPRTGDGVGNLDLDGSIGAGLADSCAACHGRPRGAAGFGGDVFTRPDSRDAPHLFGLGLVEMIGDEITQDLRALRDEAAHKASENNEEVAVRLKSKGIYYGELTVSPDGAVDSSHVKGVDSDLRVRPFFAQGQTISIREFVVGALNAEMGLESPDTDLVAASAGQDVTTPSGMVLSGSVDQIEGPPVSDEFEDSDSDGVTNEVPVSIVDHMEFYLLNYFRPATFRKTRQTRQGSQLFKRIGCAKCHVPNLTIENDRRVADVNTKYDSENGILNRLFATATPKHDEIDDGSGYPSSKPPSGEHFHVRGIYADFKRHDLGPQIWERNFDGTIQKEFMTEPLWGVGSTPPYGHDGRSINLETIIDRHGGEASRSRRKYKHLSSQNQQAVLAFLQSLVLFGPADTASNLDPGDRDAENFPQNGHGSIKLSELFVDIADPE